MARVSLRDYVEAVFPVILVETFQEDKVISDVINFGLRENYYSWDVCQGVEKLPKRTPLKKMDIINFFEFVVQRERNSAFFVRDGGAWIQEGTAYIKVIRALKNIIPHLKSAKKTIIFIDAEFEIPRRLSKEVVLYQDRLPSTEELRPIAERLISDNRDKFSTARVTDEAIISSRGLTLAEAENIYALSLIKHKDLDKFLISDERLSTVRKSGLAEIWEPVPEDQVGGLDKLKSYLKNRLKAFSDPELPNPKGILLVGIPGTGKSLSAKMAASLFEIPLVRLDIPSLKGSRVGESERKMRLATNLVESVAPVVLWLDEFEKAVGGIRSSNYTDAGTTSGMISHLLTWQQECKELVFTVATCNAIEQLPTELVRAGRFDAIFFVDLPNNLERQEIIRIMNKRYGSNIPLEWALDELEGWTGAEIEQLAKDSLFDGLDEAKKNITPISKTMSENVEALQKWARGRARPASSAAISKDFDPAEVIKEVSRNL